jgi:acyl carrier protein
MTDTTRRVCILVSRELRVDLDRVVPTASLTDDLGADLIDVESIILETEVEFDVDLSDVPTVRVATVADLIALVDGDTAPVAQAA